MKPLSTILILLVTPLYLFAQEFSSTPLSMCEQWIEDNVLIEAIKKDKPNGYFLASEENDLLVLEKKMENGDIHKIEFFYKNGELSNILFTQHSARAFRLMREAKDLNFVLDKEYVIGEVETLFYKNEKNHGVLLIIDESKRLVNCTYSKNYGNNN